MNRLVVRFVSHFFFKIISLYPPTVNESSCFAFRSFFYKYNIIFSVILIVSIIEILLKPKLYIKMFNLFLVTILFSIYFIFDFNYFLRMFFTFIWAKCFKSKVKLIDETSIYGICTTQDLDYALHMNNARYLRELDFARLDNFIRTNMFDRMTRMGITTVVSGSCTRYRRTVPFLMVYKIVMKLIHLDEKHLYYECKLINPRNNFIHTVIFTKITPIGLKLPLTEFIKELEPDIHLPEITKDLKCWLESMEYSSQILRKKN
ncbi:PREDICTED: protein THEM6-like [Polistes dominula]|uniref:Protein THEM6 n=1 Tax=Polistes dominula TaxID=743375 RepID=A0ABM1HYM8_POLDO|nr:PREDICTED: protein THEM6-like [Polistes dominula]